MRFLQKNGEYPGLGMKRMQSGPISENNHQKVIDKIELASRGKDWKIWLQVQGVVLLSQVVENVAGHIFGTLKTFHSSGCI